MTIRIIPGAPYTRRRAIASLIPLILGVFALLAFSGNTPSTDLPPCPQVAAANLNLHYTLEDGVTEGLEAFHFEVIKCEQDRDMMVCWDEENSEMPDGLEMICGTPTQLNDTLIAGYPRIWNIDISPPSYLCQEDMPCWDCRRMGNKICGSVSDDIPFAPPAIPSASRLLAL